MRPVAVQRRRPYGAWLGHGVERETTYVVTTRPEADCVSKKESGFTELWWSLGSARLLNRQRQPGHHEKHAIGDSGHSLIGAAKRIAISAAERVGRHDAQPDLV